MNSTTLAVVERSLGASRLGDYVELCKLRISVLVLVTVALSSITAAWGHPDVWLLCHTLVGTALVAFSASAWNQWYEQATDRKMVRTANRPLPSGRLSNWEVIGFGTLLAVAGVFYLGCMVGRATAFFGLATWIMYVVVYTPLKRFTTWNTFIGAIAGALPVLIGWSATGDLRDDVVLASAFFLTVFLWQFPHFMAIAWIYRQQYAEAELQMSTVADPTGLRAGVQAVLGALALMLVTVIPVFLTPFSSVGPAGWSWLGICGVAILFSLGLMQLAFAVAFLRDRNDQTSRRLLRASIVYLPLTFLLLTLFTAV